MRLLRRRLIGYLVIAAAALVVVLLLLIALGYLVLPTPSPVPVKVVQTNYTILEGKGASRKYWFGVILTNSNVSFSDQPSFPQINGYPGYLTPGEKFGADLVLWNNDTENHTVYSASVNPPFGFFDGDPAFPNVVPAGDDPAGYAFTVVAPNHPVASLVLNVTLNALNPPPM